MGTIGTLLGIAVELACFTQWTFCEGTSTSGSTALPLSLFYVGWEMLVSYVLKSREIELAAVQISVLFPVHLMVTSVSTMFAELAEDDADRAREDATKSPAVHAARGTARSLPIRNLLLLACPVATAAISISLLLQLVDQAHDAGKQTSAVAETYACLVFLASQLGDYIVYKRCDRLLFLFPEGAARAKVAGLLFLQVVLSRAIVSWMLGLAQYGTAGEARGPMALVVWEGHCNAMDLLDDLD